MALPIVDRITEDIVATLKGVRRSGGYHVDLTVERFNRNRANRIRDDLVVVSQASPTRDAEAESQDRAWWIQPYDLHYFCREPEKSTVPIDQRLNVARSDMEKALLVDWTRGGLAMDTRIEDPQLFVGETTGTYGITVRCSVHYYTNFSDPYAQ